MKDSSLSEGMSYDSRHRSVQCPSEHDDTYDMNAKFWPTSVTETVVMWDLQRLVSKLR